MNEFCVGRWKVVDFGTHSHILFKPNDEEYLVLKDKGPSHHLFTSHYNLYQYKGYQLRSFHDLINGKNHFSKACKKAKRLDEVDNMNIKLKEIEIKGELPEGFRYVSVLVINDLNDSFKNVDAELKRLKDVLKKTGNDE